MPKKTTAPEPTGYRPRERSRWVSMPEDLIEVEEGAEPFTARIRSHLTFGEIEEIPYGKGVLYADIREAIAPYVLEWNVQARNKETGKIEPVAPPAEAGVDALRFIAGAEMEWLALELRSSHLGAVGEAEGDLKKSASTPAKSSDGS